MADREFDKKRMRQMFIIVFVVFGLVIIANFASQMIRTAVIKNLPEPTFPVTTTIVKLTSWQPTLRAIGFVEPHQGVQLSNEMSGTVTQIHFNNGDEVEANTLLLELDSDVERAELKSAMVRLPPSEAQFKRIARLYKRGAVSKRDYDDAQTDFFEVETEIEKLEATIKRRQIIAPFKGIMGIRQVNLGQYLGVGTNIVRIEDLDTMKIIFTIPQNDLSKVSVGSQINVYVDAYPKTPFAGEVQAIEPAVFQESGLIQLEASIPNPDNKLLGGMFARVEILLTEQPQQVVLPQTAINFSLHGNTVFIVDKNNTKGKAKRVKEVSVKIGDRHGAFCHVLSGLKGGEEVVTSGQLKISSGSQVAINNKQALPKVDKLPQL